MTHNQTGEDSFEIKIIKYILIGLGVAIIFGVYFLLRKSDVFQIFSRLGENNLSYGLLFVTGVLASFHCVGMCGGFVVAYTAGQNLQSKDNPPRQTQLWCGVKFLPHLYYNFGRIISYTAVGAILGGIGSFFGINPVFSGVLTIAVAVFMLMMGRSRLCCIIGQVSLTTHPPT